MINLGAHVAFFKNTRSFRFCQEAMGIFLKRPLVLTQHGKSTAILLDVGEYENLLDQVELAEDIRKARMELQDGKGISSQDAHEILMTKYK